MLTKVGNGLFWNQITGKGSQLTSAFLAAICKISIKKCLLGTELPVCSAGGPHRGQRVFLPKCVLALVKSLTSEMWVRNR